MDRLYGMKSTRLAVVFLIVACGFGSVEWFNNTQNVGYMANKCERRVEATVDTVALQDLGDQSPGPLLHH